MQNVDFNFHHCVLFPKRLYLDGTLYVLLVFENIGNTVFGKLGVGYW
jgi:hypothetical protein